MAGSMEMPADQLKFPLDIGAGGSHLPSRRQGVCWHMSASAPKAFIGGAMLTVQHGVIKPSSSGDVAERLKAAVC
jgi:hypothetical protein